MLRADRNRIPVAKKDKPKKPPLGQRIGSQMRAVGAAGSNAVRNPRSIPGTAEGMFRRWFRRVWDVRGGGLYAVGYALTFAWLEVTSVVSSLMESSSIGEFITEEIWEFLFRFLGDSIANLVQAFIWPVLLLQWRQPVGLILLVAGFVLFPIFAKPVIERWLFREEPQPGDDTA
mgnify:CR=1 FL=1